MLVSTSLERPVDRASSYITVRDDVDEIVLEFPFIEVIQLGERPN
jgi:hypothetical protein